MFAHRQFCSFARSRLVGLAGMLMVLGACSSDATGEAASNDTAPESTSASTTATQSPAEGVVVSAAEGGTVTFGDATLTIPPGALAEDTEIRIAAVSESDWPQELAGTEGISVLGDFLDLQPDGLEFSVPATLTLRADDITERSDGELQVTPVTVLTHSDGDWEAMETSIVVDDDGTSTISSIPHFSNVATIRHDLAVTSIVLGPREVTRVVGGHFIADLSTYVAWGTGMDPNERSVENTPSLNSTWRTGFGVGTAPLVVGLPSRYRGEFSPLPEDMAGIQQTPWTATDADVRFIYSTNPAVLPGAYNCVAAGTGDFFAFSDYEILSPQVGFQRDSTGIARPTVEMKTLKLSLSVTGKATCVEGEHGPIDGLWSVGSTVKSDPSNHQCCVRPPADKAESKPGNSVWFTDTKLGDSTSWQGMFFDLVPGSTNDVLAAATGIAPEAPNPLEIVFADDYDTTGHFTVEGTGTVAGFSNVRVRLEAVATDSHHWTGTLTKGVDGRLPGGQSIVYDVSGTLIAPRPIGFLNDLTRAFREADSQFLLDHLHPELLDIYGGACVTFTAGLSSSDLTIDVHAYADVLDWNLSLDGHEAVIEDAVRLDVTRTENGQTSRSQMHIAARPSADGLPTEMTWFADCGEPLPTE